MSRVLPTVAAAAALLGPTLVAAPPATAGTGSAVEVVGGEVIYDGADVASTLRVTLVDGRLLFDDSVAIQRGPGCRAVAGDATRASCVATSTGTGWYPVQITSLGGNDVVVYSGPGVSTIRGGPGNDSLTGGPDKDQIFGGLGSDILTGRGQNDEILGNAGSDLIRGGGGQDQIYGLAGTDTLDGGRGEDDIDGGAGIDTVSYALRVAPLTIRLDSGAPTSGEAGEADMILGTENAIGGAASDILGGSVADNRLDGGPGDDELTGLDGADLLLGRSGSDDLFPGNGPDEFADDGAVDTADGGLGSTDVCEISEADPDETVRCESVT